MLSPQLLQPCPNKAVEDKYEDNIIFRFLRFVCNPIMSDAVSYAIYPGELFYNCIYTIDTLRKCKTKQHLHECATMVVDDIFRYFNEKNLYKSNIEVRHAICLVTYGVERCLAFLDRTEYITPISIIDMRLQQIDPGYLIFLRKRFNKATKEIGEQLLKDYMNTYFASKELLSNEIGDVIDINLNIKFSSEEKPTQKQLENIFTIDFLRSNYGVPLINFLRSEKEIASDTDWARHALAISEHKKILREKYRGFTEWLPRFCELFGRTVKYTEPNKLRKRASRHNINVYLP